MDKYLKYKLKYLTLKKQLYGGSHINILTICNTDYTNNYIHNYKFSLFLKTNYIFEQNIENMNIYMNKINIGNIILPYLNKIITNNDDFILIPNKYLDKIYEILLNKKDEYILKYFYYYLKDEIAINIIYSTENQKYIKNTI